MLSRAHVEPDVPDVTRCQAYREGDEKKTELGSGAKCYGRAGAAGPREMVHLAGSWASG